MTAAGSPRRIGQTDVRLSPICLGTMRLDRAGDTDAAAALLRYASDAGITTFHCSSEYETFPLFRDAWALASDGGESGLRLIAKVAAPHFGEHRFSADALCAKIDFYLSTLQVGRLDVVQWLLRHDLKQEEERLRILEESGEEIGAVAAELKRSGKVGAFVSFPYTSGVAAKVLREDYCDGLALYVNPLEQEMEEHVREAAELGKSVLAIRPFAAGRVFSEARIGVGEAMRYALDMPAVATAVVSLSSRAHVDALRPWTGAAA